MAQYDNTNRGALFKNDKGGNEARPDYRGNLNVNGAELEVAALIKTSKKGDKYMSLSFQPQQGQRTQRTNDAPRDSVPEFNDDIPF